MQQFRIKVEVHEAEVVLSLGCHCTDITLYWRDLFRIADLIGKSAIRIRCKITDPTEDEMEVAAIQIRRYRKEYAVLCFPRTDRFVWSAQVAWTVANKMCKAVEVFAMEHNEKLALTQK